MSLSPPSAPGRPWPRRLGAWLLTDDPVQRLRLGQALMAACLMAVAVLGVQVFGWLGVAPARPLALWGLLTVGAIAAAWLAIRSGWTRRFADATLTVPQMVFAIASGAVGYALLGPARAVVLAIVMVVLMLGMFVASPRQMRLVALYAVAVFGTTMALLAWQRPAAFPWRQEAGHFVLVATLLPAVSMLAARLSLMRHRLRRQRVELAQALERIRQLATRDELTGLVNRRAMEELLEQEHQRAVRSGRVFCIALLDIDGFKAVNQRAGRAAGDAVLRDMARQAQQALRVSDALARWESDTFLLMLADTRLGLGRSGLERLRAQLAGAHALPDGSSVSLALSAGIVEHHAGESVAQTLARATHALAEAKAARQPRLAPVA